MSRFLENWLWQMLLALFSMLFVMILLPRWLLGTSPTSFHLETSYCRELKNLIHFFLIFCFTGWYSQEYVVCTVKFQTQLRCVSGSIKEQRSYFLEFTEFSFNSVKIANFNIWTLYFVIAISVFRPLRSSVLWISPLSSSFAHIFWILSWIL